MTNSFKKKGEVSEIVSSTDSSLDPQKLQQKIAACAYELFLKRGQAHGHDLDDWLEAERAILKEIRSQGRDQSKAPGPVTGRRR
jgi:hypothetical protein